MKKERYTKKILLEDLREIINRTHRGREYEYSFGSKDIFALGYMCGKYDVDCLINNQEKVINACTEYDKTDDLMLLDTIGETLIDLKVINNKEGKL